MAEIGGAEDLANDVETELVTIDRAVGEAVDIDEGSADRDSRASSLAGKRLSRGAAIGLALGEPAHVAATAPDETSAGLLGKREADVARLVADGLSNKEIGTRLFISKRTVDSHVRSILNKLGFNSRAQIAGWVRSSNQ